MRKGSAGAFQEPYGVMSFGDIKIKPAGYDKLGPLFAKEDIEKIILQDVIQGTHFITRRKKMNDQIKEAVKSVEEETKIFTHAISNFQQQEQTLAELTKKATGSVRKSANELAEGLLKVEKMADFNKLERYVALLERAAIAFDSLAELEKTGKLEKIALAIK
jgi:hypothetical protein